MEVEADQQVAKANAQSNFERLAAGFPIAMEERERGLPAEIEKEAGSAIKKLRRLYLAMEDISKAVAPYAACRSGCASCCHYTVHLYPVEAELIEKRTGNKRLVEPETQGNFHGLPCPFLTQGRCGIYEDRPMACRKHFAMTASAYWCNPSRSGQVQLPQVQFSGVEESFEKIIQKDGRTEVLDIRQVFGVASRF